MKRHLTILFGLMLLAAMFSTACQKQEEGPAEKMGQQIDDAVEDVQEAGEAAQEPLEDAAEDLEDAAEDLGDSAEEAADTLQE